MWIIKYGESYISTANICEFGLTTNMNKAFKREQYDKCQSQIDLLKKTTKVVKKYNINIQNLEIIEWGGKKAKPPKQSKLHEVVLDFDLNNFAINLKLRNEKLLKRKEYLLDELTRLEKEQTDVLHYCEVMSLDACRGYKLYKLLKEIRIARRDTKQELDKITYILGAFNEEVEHIDKRVVNVDERQYSARILNELFEKGV